MKGAEDELGAGGVDGIAHECVDDFHERALDGLFVFQDRYGMEARLGRRAHTAEEALVEVAEYFTAKSRRFAARSVDLDVRAKASAFVRGH
jgi:hypothetical protein